MPTSPIRKNKERTVRIKNLGRNLIDKNTWETANQWTMDDDVDEFVDILLEDGKFLINYKYINNLLLFIRFKEIYSKQSLEILFNKIKVELKKYYLEYKSNIEYKIKDKKDFIKYSNQNYFILKIVETAYLLYNTLNIFPTWKIKYGEKPFVIPYLYHGLEMLELPLFSHILINLKINDIISWPLFMSTTFDKNVALRFSNSVKTNKVLLKILIPYDCFDIIKYTYFGPWIEIQNSVIQINSEIELLLNLGTKIKFLNKIEKEYTYLVPQFMKQPIKKTEIVDVYIFSFIGYTNMNDFFKMASNDKTISETLMTFGKCNRYV